MEICTLSLSLSLSLDNTNGLLHREDVWVAYRAEIQAVYLEQGGDDANDGQHDSDQQLDEHKGLDEDLLLREDHLHVSHGHVREGLDHNVALRHALQPWWE